MAYVLKLTLTIATKQPWELSKENFLWLFPGQWTISGKNNFLIGWKLPELRGPICVKKTGTGTQLFPQDSAYCSSSISKAYKLKVLLKHREHLVIMWEKFERPTFPWSGNTGLNPVATITHRYRKTDFLDFGVFSKSYRIPLSKGGGTFFFGNIRIDGQTNIRRNFIAWTSKFVKLCKQVQEFATVP